MSSASRLATLATRHPRLGRWLHALGIDPATHNFTGAKNFFLALLLLGIALLLALNGAAAFERHQMRLMVISHLLALALSLYVALRLVPRLAAATPLSWLFYQVDYKLTREGVVYLVAVLVIVVAALNTGNNLLFIVLASLLAGILVSGLVSRIVLTGVSLHLELPEHVFAGQPVRATVSLRNQKQKLPSFSLLVSGHRDTRGNRHDATPTILTRPVYFPYVPRGRSLSQVIELTFPKRGRYAQNSFAVSSKFPFGFLQKTRKLETANEIVVYPSIAPTEEFYEILPLLGGEWESHQRGRGHDLYAIRDYQPTDSARHVEWKASAKAQALKVREFTREDERRVELVFDSYLPADSSGPAWEERFERAVTFCACLAWHFYEIGAQIKYRSPSLETAPRPAAEVIYDALQDLALIGPCRGPDDDFLVPLGSDDHTFKVLLTARAPGSIPTGLWSNAYVVFFHSL